MLFLPGLSLRKVVFLVIVFLIASVSTLSPMSVQAEEASSRGRLPDGRAFRIDAKGNEIVDYIAELELAVETMTRKVHGLEDEIEEKNATIARLRSSGAKDTGVTERDLVASKSTITPQNPKTTIQPAFASEASCDSELLRLKQQSEKRVSVCQQQLSILEAKLKRVSMRATRLEESASERGEGSESEKRASLGTMPSRQVEKKPSRTTKQKPVSISKDPALEIMKGDARTSLNKLRGKIATRKKLFTSFSNKKASGVSFSLRQAIADTGRGVSALSAGIKRASSGRELSGIKRDIRQISGLVDEDIALLKRLSKGRR